MRFSLRDEHPSANLVGLNVPQPHLSRGKLLSSLQTPGGPRHTRGSVSPQRFRGIDRGSLVGSCLQIPSYVHAGTFNSIHCICLETNFDGAVPQHPSLRTALARGEQVSPISRRCSVPVPSRNQGLLHLLPLRLGQGPRTASFFLGDLVGTVSDGENGGGQRPLL